MATLAPPAPTEAAAAPVVKKGGRKKLLVLVAVLLVAAGAAWVFLKPSPAASATEAPKPGPVVALEPLTLNLADGHYLKLGLALQATEAVAAEAAGHGGGGAEAPLLDGARALDAAISVLGDRTYAQLLAPGGRAKAKVALEKEIKHRYHGEVLTVYLTQFVMQ